MLKIRRSRDRLIFNMQIPYLGKTVFILRQGLGHYDHEQAQCSPNSSTAPVYSNSDPQMDRFQLMKLSPRATAILP